MPSRCGLPGWLAAQPGQSTRVPLAQSLRVFGASPESHRRLSPELRGGILGGALAQPCAGADAMDRRRRSKPSCPGRLILFR